MVGDRSCLVRYGVMSHVGRFSAARVGDAELERGLLVVVQTDRGVELGEVLIVVNGPAGADTNGSRDPAVASSEHHESAPHGFVESSFVVRIAGSDDIARARDAETMRTSRLSLCERILRDGDWPWPLIDIEPLLDARATVLHYLGPRQVDVASLRARFRMECEFDVIFEAVGSDPDGEPPAHDDAPEHSAAGGCGSCGCSSDGGCGRTSNAAPAGHDHAAEPAASGCSTKAHSGCSSCGISRIKAEWSQTRALPG